MTLIHIHLNAHRNCAKRLRRPGAGDGGGGGCVGTRTRDCASYYCRRTDGDGGGGCGGWCGGSERQELGIDGATMRLAQRRYLKRDTHRQIVLRLLIALHVIVQNRKYGQDLSGTTVTTSMLVLKVQRFWKGNCYFTAVNNTQHFHRIDLIISK